MVSYPTASVYKILVLFNAEIMARLQKFFRQQRQLVILTKLVYN
ncbi:hypothetical protein LRLP16767_LRLP167_00038 [Limosilactobacillus reuteri]|uniref:Uncharacterized protein n=1 Tax=Limosilactobacillus reuteri TaxID=1598 RepID=A0A0U5JW85_LIMRT|nr:hypothetical protein LRLP16767_LRLP167_00038 [Limosilactobacillus reuteri]